MIILITRGVIIYFQTAWWLPWSHYSKSAQSTADNHWSSAQWGQWGLLSEKTISSIWAETWWRTASVVWWRQVTNLLNNTDSVYKFWYNISTCCLVMKYVVRLHKVLFIYNTVVGLTAWFVMLGCLSVWLLLIRFFVSTSLVEPNYCGTIFDAQNVDIFRLVHTYDIFCAMLYFSRVSNSGAISIYLNPFRTKF